MKKLFVFASFCTFLFSCNNIDSTKLKEEIIAEVKKEIINELKEVEKTKLKGLVFISTMNKFQLVGMDITFIIQP